MEGVLVSMMTFAEGGTPGFDSGASPALFGIVVLGVITLLNGILTVKNLFEKRADREAVPRGEYDELKARVSVLEAASTSLSVKVVEYVTRHELNQLRDELSRQYSRIEKYSRARSQKQSEQINAVQLNVEVLHRNLQKEIANLIGQVSEKQERTWSALAEFRGMAERRLPAGHQGGQGNPDRDNP